MKKIKNEFIKLIKNPKYTIPLIFVFILCFGYLLTHATINIDSLAYDRYFEGTELLKHERFLAPLLNKVFNIYSFNPFFHDFIGLCLLVVSSTLFCSMIKSIVGNKIKENYYTLFTALFISYPLLPEIWTYTPSNISISIGYILTFISSFLAYEFCNTKKIKLIIPSFLLLMCALSLYESFASVFLLSIFIFIFLDSFYNSKTMNFKLFFNNCWKIVLIIGLSSLSNLIVAKSIRLILGLSKGLYVNRSIYYISFGIIEGIKNLIKTLVNSYIISSLFYFPIAIFVITTLIGIYFLMYKSISNKKFNLLFLYLVIILSTISLSLLLGTAAPYRSCQTFPLFISFTFLIVTSSLKNIKMKKIFIIFIVFLIFYQSKEMHKWFYVNDLRFQSEKNVLIDIGQELSKNYDTKKPIVLIGQYNLNKSILEYMYLKEDTINYKIYKNLCMLSGTIEEKCLLPRIGQTNVNSYIKSGIYAFNENGTEINKWWKLLGYNFKMGSAKMRDDAYNYYIYLKDYPKDGYIYETESYIIVKF